MNRKSELLFLSVIVFALGGLFFFTKKDKSLSNEEDVYARISTVDGKTIPIPYSRPDKEKYMREQAAHFREVPADSATVAVGSQAVIPGWRWVEVLNSVKQRFSNGSKQLEPSDTCGVEFGGLITVLEIRGDNLFVEYTAPGNPAGTPCPSGARFLVAEADFVTMNAEYAALRDAIQAERELVRELLAKNFYGEPVDAGEWHWVKVVNLDPVIQNFRNGHGYLAYGDTCGCGRSDWGDGHIVEGGTVRARGEANGRVLYEYTAAGTPMGTRCPSGVLFFGE